MKVHNAFAGIYIPSLLKEKHVVYDVKYAR